MYGFYRDAYAGAALTEDEFNELLPRARDVLEDYRRCFRVRGGEEAEKKALCAMAEVLSYYRSAQNGQGALRYASVGSVSVSGKGIYGQLDISPQALERELYRAAGRYLEIYRGVGPW